VLIMHGFPDYAVDDAILRSGERCLKAHRLHPALSRLLSDQLDDLGRAIRVRLAQPTPGG